MRARAEIGLFNGNLIERANELAFISREFDSQIVRLIDYTTARVGRARYIPIVNKSYICVYYIYIENDAPRVRLRINEKEMGMNLCIIRD